MGYIYQIRNNITGKCYIGQTTKLPESRWKRHISSLTHKGGCPALKDAIAKHGIDSFIFRVLIICFDDAIHLIEKEYIEKYNSQVPNGYNILPGGQLGGGFLGKTHSAESIEKIKESRKKFSEANPNHYETYREKHREAMKKIDISTCIKQSEKFQKAKQEGRVGTQGPTSEEKKQKIRESLHQYYKNNNNHHSNKQIEAIKKALSKPIIQYTSKNEFIKEYKSIADAERYSGIKTSNIKHVLKGTHKTAGGFIWKYATIKTA